MNLLGNFTEFKISSSSSPSGYSITWQNKKINVFRADVICTNGIIHVIDRPFVEESDIRVTNPNAATSIYLLSTPLMLLITTIFMM